MNQISIPELADIPFVPTGPDHQLVFRAPWEAKAFALVVQLYQQGHFEWTEWAQSLGEEIRAAGADDDGGKYYLLWLTAAEKLAARKSLCDSDELRDLKADLEAAQGGAA